MMRKRKFWSRTWFLFLVLVISGLLFFLEGPGDYYIYFRALLKVASGVLLAHIGRTLLFPYWDLREIFERSKSLEEAERFKGVAIFLSIFYASVILALCLAL